MAKSIIEQLRERGDKLSLAAANRIEQSFSITAPPEKVVKIICDECKVDTTDLSRKTPEVMEAKRFCVFFLREYLHLPLKSIAPLLGVDASNVSRSHNAIKREIKTYTPKINILKKRFNF
jgi:chromosomal replication initiation ATPase DnaA